jgi:hypothetical protein
MAEPAEQAMAKTRHRAPSPHQVLERLNPVPGTQPGLSKECAEATRALPGAEKSHGEGVWQDLAGSEARQAGERGS